MTNARRRPRRANDALGRVSAVGPAGVGADVHAVIDSLDVPIVLVAPDSTIVSFNVAAATALALTPTHRGAALRQLGLAGVEDLEELCEHVITGGAACQREVRDAGGSYFMLRIAPHTTTDRQIVGAVLMLTNVTAFRGSLEQAIHEREHAKTILNAVGPLVVLDSKLRVQTANRAFYTMFQGAREETLGIPFYDLGRRQWDLQVVRQLLTDTLARGWPMPPVEVECDFPAIGPRVVQLTAHRVPREGKEARAILLTIDDVTERKRAERLREDLQASLRESRERLAEDLADMARLQQVSTRLIGTDDPAALLLEIVDAAIAVTAADMGNIQLLDPDSRGLTIVASRGFDTPFLEFFNEVHDGQAACGSALESRERVIVEDVATSPIFVSTPALDVMLAAKALAVQSTPLISRSGRVVGMFSTHYRAPRRPTDRELRVLDLLARQAADAIDRMQAKEALRQRTEQFETLLNKAPLGMYLVDADFRIRQVNPVARPFFGDIPDLIGRDFGEVIHILWPKPYADEIVQHFRRTLETGEPYVVPEHIEERLDRGVTEYYEWRINRIPLAEGRHGVVCYFRDISGQVQARMAIAESAREAQRAKAEAEAANRAKDDFLATLSHELRTPLNSMLGWTRMLRAGSLDASAAQRALEVVDRNINHQSRLITDLLDISRIISGKLTLETAVVDLTAIVSSVIETLQPSAQAKSVRISSVSGRGAVPVSGDAERLRQVAANLIANAVKFTPSGGHVTVRLESVDGRARLTVSDTGKGISPEFLPQIFERFSQGDASSTRAQAGLGLGLAIARHIVQLHQGSIRVESGGDGKGATFTVEFPLALTREEASVLIEAAPQNDMTAIVTKALESLSVLIVDDDTDSRELHVAVLAHGGARVTAVDSVRKALAVVGDTPPDVIVCDLAMPGDDGFTFIRTLRSWPARNGGAIPALALTAYARLEDRARALEAGFQFHLAKPVEPDHLLEAVDRLARRPAAHSAE